ncbi:MAG: helix-turn-helix domain containing protein [Caulobacteraceae bacterium]|nr:helix-turn-helix domain containing protein [Caulobacteraceae bacterium]
MNLRYQDQRISAISRAYQSTLRKQQAAMTRERILMAVKDHLETHDIEALTLRRVAELAGVSAPAVYAHFPVMDDLVAALYQWLKPRLGLLEPPPPLDRLDQMPERLFPLYEQYGALLRNLMNKPSWNRQRAADGAQRRGAWIETVGAALPRLAPEQRRRGALAIAAFWTPTHWRWLRDDCGLGPDEAQALAAWTIRALVEALKTDPAALASVPTAASRPRAIEEA